ncbi:MAG: Sec-independent protein translocase protein TatB [Roseibium sp.]|uniref:Sec-independent protein translocase protein TatB n=1 Tax=Roseibium sp. TaxID=1936156 RepID=UPI0032667854
MFDIGWTELMVIACVAIIVVGPKDLPRMLRTLGQTMGKVRRMSREFQSTFNDAIREAEKQADIADMKKQVEDVGNFNPLGDLKKSIEDDKPVAKPMTDAVPPTPSATGAPVTSEKTAATAPAADTPPAAEAAKQAPEDTKAWATKISMPRRRP